MSNVGPVVLISVLSFLFFFLLGGFFFRDYSIIFDGGQRILAGQVPYRDFFFSTGPITLYLQALFSLVWGINAGSMFLHVAVVSAIVLALFYKFAKERIGVWGAVVFTFCLHYFFYGATMNPWYNHTAIFFYLMAQFLIIKEVEQGRSIVTWKLIVLGPLIFLSLFSKQDIGALGLLFIFFQLLFFINDKKRAILFYTLSLLISATLLYGVLYIYTDISYWFNYGQAPHETRISLLSGLFNKKMIYDARWYLIFGSLFLASLAPKLDRKTFQNCFMVIGFCLYSLVVYNTSGQRNWTAYFSLPFAGIYLIRQLEMLSGPVIFGRSKRPMALLGSWIFLAYVLPLVFYNTTTSRFQLIDKLAPLGHGAYSKMLFSQEVREGIQKIKQELKGHQSSKKEWLLNMSSYGFLYEDLGVTPPIGTHLYYHRGISLFDKDYQERLINQIHRAKYEYILVQQMASGTPGPSFIEFLKSVGYSALFSVPTPKSGRSSQFDLTVFRLDQST